MKKLEELISESLCKAIRDGNFAYNNTKRRDWFMNHLSQVLTAVSQIIWTETCENYLFQMTQSSQLKKSKNQDDNDNEDEMCEIQNYLNDYRGNMEVLSQLVREDLTFDKHRTIVGLITSEVQNRDVLDSLIKKNICDVQNFFWQQQLR